MENSCIKNKENTSSGNILEFHYLPMPHSVNQSLSSVRGRLIKSAVARAFEYRFQQYNNANQLQTAPQIEAFKKTLLSKRPADRKILFEAKLYFAGCDLYRTSADRAKGIEVGEPKRLDTSNRIKPLEDRLSEMIGIDDKYFFFIWCSKHQSTPTSRPWLESNDAYCSARLSFIA